MTVRAAYFELISVISRAEARTPLAGLDGMQKRLIYLIADTTARGEIIRMSDIKALTAFGTAPTILSRLNGMVESRLVQRVPDPDDGRSHRITLTPKARRAIERVSRDVERAAPRWAADGSRGRGR